LKEVVTVFLEECPKLLDQLNQAVAQRNPQTLKLAAHTLKGGLRIFGPSAVLRHADDLEELGRNNRLDDVDRRFGELRAQLDPLLSELHAFVNGGGTAVAARSQSQ
jgi:HPt (histidine-containing phosphotransfer) domain-containing protein